MMPARQENGTCTETEPSTNLCVISNSETTDLKTSANLSPTSDSLCIDHKSTEQVNSCSNNVSVDKGNDCMEKSMCENSEIPEVATSIHSTQVSKAQVRKIAHKSDIVKREMPIRASVRIARERKSTSIYQEISSDDDDETLPLLPISSSLPSASKRIKHEPPVTMATCVVSPSNQPQQPVRSVSACTPATRTLPRPMHVTAYRYDPSEIISAYIQSRQNVYQCFVNMFVNNACATQQLPSRPRNQRGMCFSQVRRRHLEPECLLRCVDTPLVLGPSTPLPSGGREPSDMKQEQPSHTVSSHQRHDNLYHAHTTTTTTPSDGSGMHQVSRDTSATFRRQKWSVCLRCKRNSILFRTDRHEREHCISIHGDLGENAVFSCGVCTANSLAYMRLRGATTRDKQQRTRGASGQMYSDLATYRQHLLSAHYAQGVSAQQSLVRPAQGSVTAVSEAPSVHVVCPLCGARFARHETNSWCKHMYIFHTPIHSSSTHIACPLCQRWRGAVVDFKAHMLQLHVTRAQVADRSHVYACDLCSFGGNSFDMYCTHLLVAHSSGVRRFMPASQHGTATTHTQQGPVQRKCLCTRCGSAFDDETLLAKHWVESHTSLLVSSINS